MKKSRRKKKYIGKNIAKRGEKRKNYVQRRRIKR